LTSSNRYNKGSTVTLALVSVLIAACSGGDGSGLPPVLPPGAFGPNLSEIQANILTPSCATTGCHLGAGAPQGLRLDEANSYGMLVGIASSEEPSILRVAPGDPNNSYLIQKLEGSTSVGAQMPLNAPPRQWITDGAIDDRIPSSDPIKVTSLSPIPDSALSASPANIVAMFDRELDVSTVNAMTFMVEASGGDMTFGDGNETQITAAGISTTATSATFDLMTGVALADDTYRVTLSGSGASFIMDLDANALDGEFSGTFPSGDDIAGGDFTATFSLATPSSGATLDELQASVFTPSCAVSGPASLTLWASRVRNNPPCYVSPLATLITATWCRKSRALRRAGQECPLVVALYPRPLLTIYANGFLTERIAKWISRTT
jgi:hypothetical protein